MKKREFIHFTFISKQENSPECNIQLINKNVMQCLSNQYYYRGLFIGKILELNVDKVDKATIYLTHSHFPDIIFVVYIKDVACEYVRNIYDYIDDKEVVRAKIIRFGRRKGIAYCSFKELGNSYRKKTELASFDEKVSLLKQRFKRG